MIWIWIWILLLIIILCVYYKQGGAHLKTTIFGLNKIIHLNSNKAPVYAEQDIHIDKNKNNVDTRLELNDLIKNYLNNINDYFSIDIDKIVENINGKKIEIDLDFEMIVNCMRNIIPDTAYPNYEFVASVFLGKILNKIPAEEIFIKIKGYNSVLVRTLINMCSYRGFKHFDRFNKSDMQDYLIYHNAEHKLMLIGERHIDTKYMDYITKFINQYDVTFIDEAIPYCSVGPAIMNDSMKFMNKFNYRKGDDAIFAEIRTVNTGIKRRNLYHISNCMQNLYRLCCLQYYGKKSVTEDHFLLYERFMNDDLTEDDYELIYEQFPTKYGAFLYQAAVTEILYKKNKDEKYYDCVSETEKLTNYDKMLIETFVKFEFNHCIIAYLASVLPGFAFSDDDNFDFEKTTNKPDPKDNENIYGMFIKHLFGLCFDKSSELVTLSGFDIFCMKGQFLIKTVYDLLPIKTQQSIKAYAEKIMDLNWFVSYFITKSFSDKQASHLFDIFVICILEHIYITKKTFNAIVYTGKAHTRVLLDYFAHTTRACNSSDKSEEREEKIENNNTPATMKFVDIFHETDDDFFIGKMDFFEKRKENRLYRLGIDRCAHNVLLLDGILDNVPEFQQTNFKHTIEKINRNNPYGLPYKSLASFDTGYGPLNRVLFKNLADNLGKPVVSKVIPLSKQYARKFKLFFINKDLFRTLKTVELYDRKTIENKIDYKIKFAENKIEKKLKKRDLNNEESINNEIKLYEQEIKDLKLKKEKYLNLLYVWQN